MMAEKEEQNISEKSMDTEESSPSSPQSDMREEKISIDSSENLTGSNQSSEQKESSSQKEEEPAPKKQLTPYEKAIKKFSGRRFRDRNEGIKLLSRVKDQRAEEKLLEIVKNKNMNERLRVAALDGLSRGKRDAGFRKFLQDIAGNQENPQELRRSAITHLARFRDTKLIPTFTAVLKDPYRFIRFWAVRGLIKINDPKAMTGLIQALGDEDEEIRKEVMAHLESGKQVSFPALVKAVQNPESNKFLRYGALGIIGRMGHNDRIPVLIKALKDEDPRIITIALRGLGKGQDPQAIEPLLKLYMEKPRKRRLIEDALYRIGQVHQQEVIKALIPLMLHEDEILVKLAESLMAKFNNTYVILGDLKESDQIEPPLKEKITEFMKSL